MLNKQWYCIRAQLAHQGAGRSLEVEIYVWVSDPIGAYAKYKNMRGIQRARTPDISLYPPDKIQDLEKKIVEDGLEISDAKKYGILVQKIIDGGSVPSFKYSYFQPHKVDILT